MGQLFLGIYNLFKIEESRARLKLAALKNTVLLFVSNLILRLEVLENTQKPSEVTKIAYACNGLFNMTKSIVNSRVSGYIPWPNTGLLFILCLSKHTKSRTVAVF